MSTGLTVKTGVETFGSVSVAMVTPFDTDGALDIPAARKLAAHLVDNGLDALVVSGTTGESPTTTVDEKLELLKAVKDEVGDRAKIMAGVGTNNTATTIDLAKKSAEAGADSLLVVTPYYSKPSQAGLIAHYTAVAQATDLPISLYDIPGRSGISVESDTIAELAKLPTIQAVKDAKGDLHAACNLMQETGLAWYSGDDPANLPWLSVGASGFISVIGHAAPRALRELYDAYDEGNLARAREIHTNVLTPLIQAQQRLGGANFAKAALREQGIEVGEPRLPLAPLDHEQVDGLRRDLDQAGVL